MKKSWRERLASDRGQPQMKPIPEKMRKKAGEGTILIPSLRQVDEATRKIRRGRVTTISHLSENLARKHGATIGCNVTTGILMWIVANAAHEEELDGGTKLAPYWRVLKVGGELNAKYPCGIASLQHRLESEGHSIVRERGHRWLENYASKLAKL